MIKLLKGIFKREDELKELKEINAGLVLLNANMQDLNNNLVKEPQKPEQIDAKTIKVNVNNEGLKEIFILLDYLIMNTDIISKRKYLELKKRLNYAGNI